MRRELNRWDSVCHSRRDRESRTIKKYISIDFNEMDSRLRGNDMRELHKGLFYNKKSTYPHESSRVLRSNML